jgi:hypothetical protein
MIQKIPTITIQSNLSKNLKTSRFFLPFLQILLEKPIHKRYNPNLLTKPNNREPLNISFTGELLILYYLSPKSLLSLKSFFIATLGTKGTLRDNKSKNPSVRYYSLSSFFSGR